MSPHGLPFDGEVHVWTVDIADVRWDMLRHVLSRDENERAVRFRTDELQRAFQRCRAALRAILASYSHEEPANIRFFYGEFGKPEAVASPVRFNLSHSGNKAIVAVSMHPVGADVERIEEVADIAGLIDMVCHPHEKEMMGRLSEVDRCALFYRTWTRKEAYCKATGTGLRNDMSRLRCDLPDGAHTSRMYDEASPAGGEFYVHDLRIWAGYSASVCVPVDHMRMVVMAAEPESFNVPMML